MTVRFALFTIALVWTTGADALCRVTLADLPDAKEIAQQKDKMAAVLKAPAVVRLERRKGTPTTRCHSSADATR